LSAGGGTARAYHAGTLAALAALTGWDPRRADLIVGTSAGATAAAYLRAGLAVADDYARFTGGELSPEGAALVARIRPQPTPDVRGDADRGWAITRPMRASLVLRALTGRAALGTALAGLVPAGRWSNVEQGDRVRDVTGASWPEEPTWICTVRVRDGRRIVFGRDDVVTPDIATAVRASCAVPRAIQPVRIGDDDYVDGAVHSSTNADLVAALAFDAVVIVSSMTAPAPRLTPTQPSTWWFSRLLRREVAKIREHGTAVLVIEPTDADLAARSGRSASQLTVARQAYRSLAEHLERPDATQAVALLRDAAAAQAHR
ncbi:MAG TPA: patatin-like phospholipase family protein, partial [Acidimicrobiales bacterium]